MSFVKTSLTAAVLALSCSAMSALAAASSNVSLTNIQLTVEDLNTGDLVLPSFDIANSTQNTVLGLSLADVTNYKYYGDAWYGSDWLTTPKSLTYDAPRSTATASVGVDSMSASGLTLSDGGTFIGYAMGPASGYSNFTLSAHTSVRIRALASVDFSLDARQPLSGVHVNGFDQVLGKAGILLRAEDGQNFEEIFGLEYEFYDRAIGHDAVSYEGTKWLEVLLVNNSNQALTGQLNVFANAVGGTAAVVPEPSELALTLAGLGVLGAWARRKPVLSKTRPPATN